MYLNKTTKAFMCLKSVLFLVLILPNLAVKVFLCAYSLSKGFVLIFEQQRLHVLIKNECDYGLGHRKASFFLINLFSRAADCDHQTVSVLNHSSMQPVTTEQG